MKVNYNGTLMNQSATISEKSAADIADARLLLFKYDSDGNVVLATDGKEPILGLASNEAGYNDMSGEKSGIVKSGQKLDIQIKDIGVVIASMEIKKGQEITATAGGKAAVAKEGEYVIGIALGNASSEGWCRIQISKYQKVKVSS